MSYKKTSVLFLIGFLILAIINVPTLATSGDSALLLVNEWIGAIQEEALYDSLLQFMGLTTVKSDSLPSDLSSYRVVILGDYSASNPTSAEYIRNYLEQGGGVLLLAGVPLFLGMPDYVGATNYINQGGSARTVRTDLFCSGVDSGSVLVSGTGGSAAALNGPTGSAEVLALWNEDPGFIFALRNEYGAGRVYFQSGTPLQLPNCPECGVSTADWIKLTDSAIRWLAELLAIPGDLNNDKKLNIVDVVYLVNIFFKSWVIPEPTCLPDVNGDSLVSFADIIYLANHTMKGGPAPLSAGYCCFPVP